MRRFCIILILLAVMAAGCAAPGRQADYSILRRAEQAAAKISDYTLAADPAADDILIGTDISDTTMAPTGTTKRYRLRDLPVSDPVAAALGLKQDPIAAAVDQEIIDGTEAAPRLISPAQTKLAAQTHGGTSYPGVTPDGANGISVAGAVSMGASSLTPVTVATLPASPSEGQSAVISDGADVTDCTVGGGTTTVECFYSEGAWVSKIASSAGSGDITGVLGDSTGAVPILYQTWAAFTGADATPDVSAGQNFKTGAADTYTDFDDGGDSSTLQDGRYLYILCLHAAVFDFTSSGLHSIYGEDYTASVGQILVFSYDSANALWRWENPQSPTETISAAGLIASDGAGGANARTLASGDGITWTNGDGAAGNPTPSVAYPFNQTRTITTPADADDYCWFRAPAALTLSGFNCFVEGTTPSITVNLQECDSAGANCASVLSAAVTANGGNDAGTITDTAIASGAWMRVLLGAQSGTVSAITFTLDGTQ